jgi:hypothetical protein
VKSVCYQPTKTCKTAGDLKRLLENIPDDMPLQPTSYSKKDVIVRFEQEEGNNENKWLTLGGSGW